MAEETGTNKTALALAAAGTEEMELVITVDILRRCGIDVTVASVSDEEGTSDVDLIIPCSRDVNIKADTTLRALFGDKLKNDAGLPDVVILPGGLKGSQLMSKAPMVKELLQRCDAAGKLIAAICAAPTVFIAHGNMFAGRRVTSYPAFKDQMNGAGYAWEDASDSLLGRVVRDGNLLTSMGPGTSFDFGLTIGSILVGLDKAKSVATGMLYKWPLN
ncbi:protein dj-1beta-like [Anopheles ziemanni]|uniref:protein dj-1beta-like n=1 Tax=Anopheles coustani TaxID=139045 RepID=UPI00265A9133|nr:protein dj-1beta-like [Anopheles coustani]XP_058175936.1 protein dj-1beta-like [Anopheles ziemanni]